MKPSKNLLKIDKKLEKINGKLSFFAINPTNVEKEKAKFFKINDYNPQFEYAPYRENLELIKKRLRTMKPGRSVIGKIFTEKKNSFIVKADLLQNRGEESFTDYSINLYGKPDKELVKYAKKLLILKKPRRRSTMTSKQVVKKMRKAFLKYGVNWKVREKDMVSKAAVMGSEKELRIKKNEKFSPEIVKRLIVHEIGTHIMRIENGSEQPYRIFRYGFPGYLETEEGLAVVNEELNNCLHNRTLRVYAGRVLAIDKALQSSFRETYNYMKKHFDKQLAFRLTLRAKRGLADTSQPGACTKDLVYLKGYVDIKKYIQKGGELDKLYYGKIGLQHIELMDKIPGLIHPYYLPMFRYFNFIASYFSKAFTNLVVIGLTPIVVLKPIKDIFKPITDYINPLIVDPFVQPMAKMFKPYKRHLKPLKKIIKMHWLLR